MMYAVFDSQEAKYPLKSIVITKHSLSLFHLNNQKMEKLFEIVFLEEAFDFLRSLERKHYTKILYNIRKVQIEQNPELFKKPKDDIWEFRTLYQGLQYRFLAFWDNISSKKTLVISTHGFIKKQQKVPEREIQKAIKSRKIYFEEKAIKNSKR